MVVSELADKPSLILACCSLAFGHSANRTNCAKKPVEALEVISGRMTYSWRDLNFA